MSQEELLRTRDSMASRGPDGEGLWISPRCDVGLGHRRLAIIDLSDAGAQPMTSPDGRYVIVYNGEIYNYRELRKELEGGFDFRSQSDTEVLIAAYARHGTEMLPKLRGMYAFAIWDCVEKRLFAARDPLGVKPFYYAWNGSAFRFASQVKALEASRALALDVDPAGVCGFLLWGSVPEPLTIRKAIRALPAGHWITVRQDGMEKPRTGASPEVLASKVTDIQEALEASVRAHLVSDVPIGVFLSAGLDSCLLTAIMRRHVAEPPLTFTLAFDQFRGTPLDEAPGAAAVAQALGCTHVERRVGIEDLERLWPLALRAMDQPSIDGFNVFVVSHYAKEAGLKVVLSGLGGDEIFGSYPSFRDVPRWRRWARLGSHLPGVSAAVRWLGEAASRPKAAGFFRYGTSMAGAYFLRRGLFLPEELPSLLDAGLVAEGLAAYDPEVDAGKYLTEGEDGWSAVQIMEASQYMRNQLLRDADWASMAHSLELRVPLVDSVLYRAFHGGGFAEAREEGKAALTRRAAPELPPQIFVRRKSGFMIPWSGTHGFAIDRGSRWGLQSRLLALETLKAFGVDVPPLPSQPTLVRSP